MKNNLKIGLFGFGCVGQGLYHVLNNSTGFKADIVKIGLKDKQKPRIVANDLITFDKWEILNNSEINVVVELIDDADEAFIIVSEALKRGKNVVTANKKMLAYHLSELIELQKIHQVALLYEASACGSIPIIRTIEEYFDNEDLEKVSGIFNGTTNYILTKIINEKLSYDQALQQAQENGFAESNPVNDVEGFDPKFKTIILAFHAFGIVIKQHQVFNIGITTLSQNDINYSLEKSYRIKLTPVIQRLKNNKVTAFVIPQFVKQSQHLFYVDNEFNGVIVEGKFSGEQFLQGRGAGSFPTGAAVLSDVSALSYGYKYEYKKYQQNCIPEFTNDVIVEIYFRYQSQQDLKYLVFDQISEKYNGKDYHYIIGKINLSTLIEHREYILTHQLFIALLNPRVELAIEKNKVTVFKKELAV